MLLRIAAICLLTSTISVVCRHFHKHHHSHKHSKRDLSLHERSEESLERMEKNLRKEIECWNLREAENKVCTMSEDQNSDEFFAACYSITNLTSGCWVHQAVSLLECKPDCIVSKDSPAPFCCCTTPNCNHPSRIIRLD